ncbi:hypothetical protein GQ55_9G429600 [Panicum hallii var. hallii]|uniref:Uncharacterized protein n=1 Tax=Panicum hallii var. hallii TaxID=1504633 RepID=A0A2T7CB72_9POAL|nr:hypothetical protein GQ55_9G429600 [Panicum hallii var. hallii]
MHRDIWHVSRRCCSRQSYRMSMYERDTIHTKYIQWMDFVRLFY